MVATTISQSERIGFHCMFPRSSRFSLVAPTLFSVLLLGCQTTPVSQVAQTAVAAASDIGSIPHDVPRRRDADDLGRFIAGLPGTPGSPFLGLEGSDAWKEHRGQLDAEWRKAEIPLIGGLQEFQKEELNRAEIGRSTVFYPFSGPDAVTLVLCFPQSPVYVMAALEPAGTLPTAAQIEKKDLSQYLAGIRATVDSELARSFFITRQMDRQFRGQVTDGLLLPILHLLVRTHHTILGFRYIRLDEQGNVIDRAANYHAPGKIGNKGIEIEFRREAEPSSHKLYYFSVDLSDKRLKGDQPFLTYLARMNSVTTLLKATSYMPHKPGFSVIRDQILARSGAILQDDSGIPYKYFVSGGWMVQLYGEYKQPYGSFRWLEQPDLRKAFEAGHPKPLNMRLGYGYSKVESNLLLARRP